MCGFRGEPQIQKILYLKGFSDPHGAKSLLNFDFQKSVFLAVPGGSCAGKANGCTKVALLPLADILASVRTDEPNGRTTSNHISVQRKEIS